jgi:hypothetical protein
MLGLAHCVVIQSAILHTHMDKDLGKIIEQILASYMTGRRDE